MSPLGIILLIVLIVILFGGISPHFYQGAPWGPGYGWGYGGIGLIGILLIVLLVLLVSGHFPY
jgi:hypothetical protein